VDPDVIGLVYKFAVHFSTACLANDESTARSLMSTITVYKI